MEASTKRDTKVSKTIRDLFPFFIELLPDMSIESMGPSMIKIATEIVLTQHISLFFSINKPDSLSLFSFLVQSIGSNSVRVKHIKSCFQFRTQVYRSGNRLYLLCSPAISNFLKDDDNSNLEVRDYAIYDTMPDFLFTMQAQANSIQEIKALNQHLKEQRKELLFMNQELENYVSIASHDLQTPLRSIVGFSQILKKNLSNGKTEELEEFTNLIIANGKKMKQILDDLLVYSSLGDDIKERTKVSLDTTLKEVKELLWSDIRLSRAIIEYEDLPTLNVHPRQMNQLFMNLLTNGIKFSQAHLTPEIKINWQRKSDHYLFEIQDNGIGIEAKYQDRIFKLFQRLHKDSEYSGTGIGLAICKRIVEQHSGEIWFESQSGKGTSFFFTIKSE